MEEFQSSGEKYKAFKDICKNASVEDWAALKNSEKKTYVCMKRKYDTMTRLGFMRPKNWNTKSPDDDSDEDQNTENQDESLQEASNKQLRKQPKVMAKNIAKGENDLKLLPVTRDSELAQKQLYPSGNARASGQQIQKSSGM